MIRIVMLRAGDLFIEESTEIALFKRIKSLAKILISVRAFYKTDDVYVAFVGEREPEEWVEQFHRLWSRIKGAPKLPLRGFVEPEKLLPWLEARRSESINRKVDYLLVSSRSEDLPQGEECARLILCDAGRGFTEVEALKVRSYFVGNWELSTS